MTKITEQVDCTITRVCHWTQDCQVWESSCGIEWCFPEWDTTPKDNDMNYCPKCGAILVEHPYNG